MQIASAYAEMVLYMRQHLEERDSDLHKANFSTKWNPIHKLYAVPAGTTKVLTFELFFHVLLGLVETYVGESFPFYDLLIGILVWTNGFGECSCRPSSTCQ